MRLFKFYLEFITTVRKQVNTRRSNDKRTEPVESFLERHG